MFIGTFLSATRNEFDARWAFPLQWSSTTHVCDCMIMRPGTQFETEHFGDDHMRTLTDPAGDKKKALQMIYCKMNQAYMFLQISLTPLFCSFVCQ